MSYTRGHGVPQRPALSEDSAETSHLGQALGTAAGVSLGMPEAHIQVPGSHPRVPRSSPGSSRILRENPAQQPRLPLPESPLWRVLGSWPQLLPASLHSVSSQVS